MFTFGLRSRRHLSTCHIDLQRICQLALSISAIDFSIIWGYRNEVVQKEIIARGVRALPYGLSKHNQRPSLAVDIAPYPIDWHNIRDFKVVSYAMRLAACKLNIPLVWGGDWRDPDWGHYELVE